MQGSNLGVRYGAAGRVRGGVQFAPDPETRSRGGSPNEVHDHFMADQRLAAPVLADGGKQAVFNLIPLAGSGRQVAHCDLQSGFVCQTLQLQLPEAQPVAVAPARIRGDQQAGGMGVERSPHPTPPTPNALDREAPRIMVYPDADPSLVLGHIVDPVGTHPAQCGNPGSHGPTPVPVCLWDATHVRRS